MISMRKSTTYRISTNTHQSGVALITALLIVSLATILAVSLVDHLHYDTRRTQNILRLDQADLANTLIIDGSRVMLTFDGKLNEYDTILEAGAFDLKMNEFIETGKPIKGGSAEVHISDLQGCFNLNNVVQQDGINRSPEATTAYTNLLGALDFSNITPPPNIAQLVDSLVDWIDSNQQPGVNGAEFDYYSSLDVPYQTSDSPLASISELNLIQGYNQEVIDVLKNHVCILPLSATPSNININTASSEVIQSYIVNKKHTDDLVEYRDENTTLEAAAFDTNESIKSKAKSLGVDDKVVKLDQFQVATEYFLIESMVTFDTSIYKFFTVIHRDPTTHETIILRQTRGDL